MSPLTPKDNKKRSILDTKSSRITKQAASVSSASLAVKSTRASTLRKERTSLTSSQKTDSRPPPPSRPSPSQTINKSPVELQCSITNTTRSPMTTPTSSLKTPRIQPRRQNPIVSRSTQPKRPDTTASNTVAAGTKRKSFEPPNSNIKKRPVLDTKQKLNNLQERIETDNTKIAELSEFKTSLESDVLGKEVQALEVAKRVNDLETEKQEKIRKYEQDMKSFQLQKETESRSHEKDLMYLKENEQNFKREKVNMEEELVALEAEIHHHATEHKSLKRNPTLAIIQHKGNLKF
ncbi:hypothetical protein BDF14DRAFT_1273038 [Spinellus fusiger]|nr:hypothetical protein BDF14DRAFT_1273038 [Spinellus fusiger]